MDYYEGVIRNTEFFTTSELAEKLKMNVQVITRKVQSGEISAYKIGKDWRIPEQSVFDWLEQRSNKNGTPKPSARRNVRFVKPTVGSVAPTTPNRLRTKRRDVLEYVLAKFETNRTYAEDEVDRLIGRQGDGLATVRGELVGEGMLEKVDGGYRRCATYKLSG